MSPVQHLHQSLVENALVDRSTKAFDLTERQGLGAAMVVFVKDETSQATGTNDVEDLSATVSE
ncbi:hypothetical protein [Ensifer canadensis]